MQLARDAPPLLFLVDDGARAARPALELEPVDHLVERLDHRAQLAYALLLERRAFRGKDGSPEYRFVSSGDAALFQALGARFLGPEIGAVQERTLGAVR